MNVYKVELMIINFDEVDEEETVYLLENVRYPNHCFSPNVVKIESKDIGEWDDDNPLNNVNTWKEEYYRLFGENK